MTVLWVVFGSAVGAPARYAVSRALNSLGGFPWGTISVNLAGSLALGVMLGQVSASDSGDPHGWQVGVVAFAGSFTTYSAFALESVELDRRRGLLYTIVSVGGALTTAALGWWIAAR